MKRNCSGLSKLDGTITFLIFTVDVCMAAAQKEQQSMRGKKIKRINETFIE